MKNGDYVISQFTCPDCGNTDAKMISHLMDIPYYNDFMMLNFSCDKCGFRKNDFFNTHSKGHTIYRYVVDGEEDKTTKVVRAETGTVRIPEIGIAIEPVNTGHSWIRNVEGILRDMMEKLNITKRDLGEDPETLSKINKLEELINKALDYNMQFTIVVDDPMGNSLIIPAIKEKLIIEVIGPSPEPGMDL